MSRFSLLSTRARRIGIDLGTSRTRIWSDRDGVVVDEPSCVAVEIATHKVIAVGNEAAQMAERVGAEIKVYFPIKNGKMYDADVTRAMLKVFLQRVMLSAYFLRPLMMASVPTSATPAARQAVTDVLMSVGAREAYTIAQPLAAAIGAGVPIADASGSFVMVAGAGVSEAAVISLGSLVASQASPHAGQWVDTQLQRLLKEKNGLAISGSVAKKIKKRVATLLTETGRTELIGGQDMLAHSPKEVTVTAEEVQPVVVMLLERYVRLLKQLLAQIPPALSADIIDKGLLLAGGLGQLHGLEACLTNELGIPVALIEDPERAVIKGVASALEHVELLRDSLGYTWQHSS